MYIYSCEPNWEAMLTCIYEAWASGRGHANIRLVIEPVQQYTLFDEYIHVDADPTKAASVAKAVNYQISPQVYYELGKAGMAYEEDRLDVIYRVMILGFAYGANVLKMMQYRDVMRCNDIACRVGREANRFQEIVRFHQVDKDYYVAHIEPKSQIVTYLGPVFQDRMPSENWMIVDDVHREALVHRRNEPFFVHRLNELEFDRLLETERDNDSYTDLWKLFYETIAIKERKNEKCQLNHFPIWARTHAVEFH